MIEETGWVVAVDQQTAQVRIERRSACGHCAVRGGCGTSLLERYFGRKTPVVTAANPIEAANGEQVVVGIPEGSLLVLSFAAYLVPLLGLIGGGTLGALMSGGNGTNAAEFSSLLLGVTGFVAGLFWVRRFGQAKAADPAFRPIILRRSQSRSVVPDVDGLV